MRQSYPSNAFVIGKAHGRRLRRAVRANLANFEAGCRAAGLERAVLVKSAKRIAQDYSDRVLEEIRGIAAGAGVTEERLLAFNLCHGAVFSDECTVLFAMSDATASGKVLFLKNSDKIGGASLVGQNFHEHKEINVVLAILPGDQPGLIGVTAAGSTGIKMGVNTLGVAVGTNIVRTKELRERGLDGKIDTTGMRALDRIQLAREGLQKASAFEAATYMSGRLAKQPTATPGNIEFVDSRTGVIVEGSYDSVALHVVQSGVAARANAFAAMRDLNDPEDVSSRCRYARARELLTGQRGKLSPALLRQFSQDHTNGPGPNSICRHGTRYEEETSQSSMVIELDRENPGQTRYWIAMGKPCHAWKHSDGNYEGRVERLEQVPPGFLDGETWKRYWSEEPNEEVEGDRA
jgi:hypothetical protein